MLFNLPHTTSGTNYQLMSSLHVPCHLSKLTLKLIISAYILTGHVTTRLRFACDASACARYINCHCHCQHGIGKYRIGKHGIGEYGIGEMANRRNRRDAMLPFQSHSRLTSQSCSYYQLNNWRVKRHQNRPSIRNLRDIK